MANPVPAWFRALVTKGRTQIEAAKVGITRATCKHWWQQETIWAHAAEPEARKVMHRRALCILCGEVQIVDTWKGFDPGIPSEYEQEELLEKAGIHE